MNQCCLKGMVFKYMDHKLNKDSQVRGSKRRYDATGADDVSDKGEDADDEDDGEPAESWCRIIVLKCKAAAKRPTYRDITIGLQELAASHAREELEALGCDVDVEFIETIGGRGLNNTSLRPTHTIARAKLRTRTDA
jgi:hypothetical protein